MPFDLVKARKVASECGDAETAEVIYSLVREAEASRKRETKLKNDILDIQFRVSVMLTTLTREKEKSEAVETVVGTRSEMRGPEITVTYVDEIWERDRTLEALMRNVMSKDKITYGRLDTKGVEKDGLIVDGTV